MTLRERIRNILNEHFRSYGMTYEMRLENELEALAREIRAEALKEAKKVVTEHCGSIRAECLDSFIDSAALAAMESEK